MLDFKKINQIVDQLDSDKWVKVTEEQFKHLRSVWGGLAFLVVGEKDNLEIKWKN